MEEKSAAALVAELCDLLNVERLDGDLFRGPCTKEVWPRIFGGQVIGQALAAAALSVEDGRPVNSLHAYFVRPGNPKRPVIYRVERDKDGRSFCSRRIIALQDGKTILSMAASFHVEEPGLSHSTPMPDVPPPESLPNAWAVQPEQKDVLPARLRSVALQRRAVEFRRVEPRVLNVDLTRTRQHLWFRTVAPLPDNPVLHCNVLAYASDFFLMEAILLPHGLEFLEERIQAASLDHAIWFHAPVRVDDWLLFVQGSGWTGGARGLAQGQIFSRDGKLVATLAQEGMIRVLEGVGASGS